MYARVARYQVAEDQVDAAIESFDSVVAELEQLDGLVKGYLFVDEETGDAVTVTIWDSRASVMNSETRAASLRQRAMRSVDGAVQSVCQYGVAREFGRAGVGAGTT